MNEIRPGPGEPRREALGDVARDVMDHLSMMARDQAKMARLSARHYLEHLRAEVAPRALFLAAVSACVALAGVCFLIALFLGIAAALGSVAWTFLIFTGLFGAAAVALAGLASRPARLPTGVETRARPAEPPRQVPAEGEPRVERWEIIPHHNGQSKPVQPR
jgi:hypothetical protein